MLPSKMDVDSACVSMFYCVFPQDGSKNAHLHSGATVLLRCSDPLQRETFQLITLFDSADIYNIGHVALSFG